MPGRTLEEKLMLNSVQDGDCLRWTRTKNQKGYGRVWWNGRLHSTHRLSYEVFVGEIPEGKEIDHLCRVRDCLNPEHLQAVQHVDNVRRSTALITRCANGHEYTGENTRLVRLKGRPGLSRRCITCFNAYERDLARRQKLGLVGARGRPRRAD